MEQANNQQVFDLEYAAGLRELGVKLLDDEGNVMTDEQVVDYLNSGNKIYDFFASFLELDETWMCTEDGDGGYYEEKQGVTMAISGDTVWFYERFNHIAEGSPLEYDLEEISARELRKAFNVDDDDALVAEIQKICQFEQKAQYIHGWSELKDCLKKKGVHFVEKFYNWAPMEED